MNWKYTYNGHEEIVSDEQKVAMQKVSLNGNYEPIKAISTPPEAVQATEKKTKGNPNE